MKLTTYKGYIVKFYTRSTRLSLQILSKIISIEKDVLCLVTRDKEKVLISQLLFEYIEYLNLVRQRFLFSADVKGNNY